MADLNKLYLDASATVKEFQKNNSVSWTIRRDYLLPILLGNYIALVVISQSKEGEFLSSVISAQERIEAAILGGRMFSRKQLNSLEESITQALKETVPALSKQGETEEENVLSEFTFLDETVSPEVLLSLLSNLLTHYLSSVKWTALDQDRDVESSVDENCWNMLSVAEESKSQTHYNVVQKFFDRAAKHRYNWESGNLFPDEEYEE